MFKKVLPILLVLLSLGIIGAQSTHVWADNSEAGPVAYYQRDLKIKVSDGVHKPGEEVKVSLTGIPEEYSWNRVHLDYTNTAWYEKNEGTRVYNQNARTDVYLKYNEETKAFEGSLYLPEKALNGEWKLTNGLLPSIPYNEAGLDIESTFQVESGFSDITAPEIKDFSFYNGTYENEDYQSEPVYVKAGETLTAVIDARDEGFGPNSDVFISFNNIDNAGEVQMVAESVSLKSIPGTTKFTGSITVPDKVKSGEIGLRVWGVEDDAGNSLYDPDIIQDYKKILVGEAPVKEIELDADYKPELTIENEIGTVNADADFNAYINNSQKHMSFQFSSADVNQLKLPLTKEQIQTLKANGTESITFGSDKVSFTMPVANLSENETEFILVKKGLHQNSLTNIFEFQIVQDGKQLHNFKEKVTLVFPGVTQAKNPAVYYIDSEDKLSEIDSRYEGSTVYGYTDHFSQYVVLEKPVKAPANKAEIVDTNNVDSGLQQGGISERNNAEQPDDTPKEDSVQETNSVVSSVVPKVTNEEKQSNESNNIEGKKLPKTASNHYNLIVLGAIATLFGAAAMLLHRIKSTRR
ncbi:hypothetical protein [Terribacillus sp. AE2B 122]|uniref:hypothetical protein n=1 Tax=Terribacillus sp. AE2B 122 TaxID=1331902 RepID=UPI001581FE82|nr:hypothetical protein [Terribacillus sp. AE2B 122]